jgi:streptogrisin C
MKSRIAKSRLRALACTSVLAVASGGLVVGYSAAGTRAEQVTDAQLTAARVTEAQTEAQSEAQPAQATLETARESVGYLAGKYGISKQEALRRLNLQNAAAQLLPRLRRDHADDFGGMWLDQENGGVLVVRTTRSDLMTGTLRAVRDRAHVKVLPSRWSLKDLHAAGSRLSGGLGAKPGSAVEVLVDEQANQVRVRYRDRPGIERYGDRARQAAATEPGMAIAERQPSEPKRVKKGCDLFACDTPARGGIRLDLQRNSGPRNGSWGSCTLGFNVRGSNGWVYTLTAGHCVSGSEHQQIDQSYHNGLPMGFEDPTLTNPSGGDVDYAIMPFGVNGQPVAENGGWAHYWLNGRSGKNRVFSKCVPNIKGYACSGGTRDYYMQGIKANRDIVPGEIVCATGTGAADVYPDNSGYLAGTKCGRVLPRPFPPPTGDVAGFINTDICSRPGDSGGPLFSQTNNRAYGILTDGTKETHECKSHEISWYSPLSRIFANAKARSGIDFSLVT